MNENNKINDNALDNVAGGYIFEARDIIGADEKNRWEVLDEKGDVKYRCSSRDDAIAKAGELHLSHEEIFWDRVLELRGQK